MSGQYSYGMGSGLKSPRISARSWAAAVIVAMSWLIGSSAGAADLGAPGPAPLFGPGPTVPDSSWFELRLGAYAHDPFKNEKGSVDIGAEVVFNRWPIATAPGWEFLVPRPAIGIMANTAGKTSYGYVANMWTIDITRWLFIEPVVGAAIHDGELNTTDPGRDSMGCRVLWHVGGNVGVRLGDHWSVMASWRHISNANLCARNNGIDGFGAQIGYRF
jgi:lipid A 3-O-deacylase